MGRRESVSLVELRLLDGPNLYFTRPAVKLVVALPGWLALSEQRARAVEPGPLPTVTDPRIPVIAVTGTNGKTTTVRLIAHLARTAGLSVAYSSTDGVYLDDTLVEEGDYSGFGGAARALSQSGVDLAV